MHKVVRVVVVVSTSRVWSNDDYPFVCGNKRLFGENVKTIVLTRSSCAAADVTCVTHTQSLYTGNDEDNTGARC